MSNNFQVTVSLIYAFIQSIICSKIFECFVHICVYKVGMKLDKRDSREPEVYHFVLMHTGGNSVLSSMSLSITRVSISLT